MLSQHNTTAALLAEATSLETEGRALDALALLRAAPSSAVDAAVAHRLVHLRTAAFKEHLQRRGSPGAVVPRPPSQTALTIEPPSGISLSSLTPARIREQLSRHGCVLVPGLVPPGVIPRLIETIDQTLAAHDAFVEGHSQQTGWFDPMPQLAGGMERRGRQRAAGAVLAVDSPLGLETLIRTYAELGIERLVTDYFGERPAISANKTTLRRVKTTGETGWHQDGRFLGTSIRSLNVWVTLTDCGVDAPGLDIVPVYPDRILETGTGAAHFDWTIDHAVVVREFGAAATWTSVMSAGDALLFDHMLIHRTTYHPSMKRSRHALETWFFAPSAYPATQTPLLV